MRKNLIRLNTSTFALGFHATPNIGTIQWLAAPGGENCTFTFMNLLEILRAYPKIVEKVI